MRASAASARAGCVAAPAFSGPRAMRRHQRSQFMFAGRRLLRRGRARATGRSARRRRCRYSWHAEQPSWLSGWPKPRCLRYLHRRIVKASSRRIIRLLDQLGTASAGSAEHRARPAPSWFQRMLGMALVPEAPRFTLVSIHEIPWLLPSAALLGEGAANVRAAKPMCVARVTASSAAC